MVDPGHRARHARAPAPGLERSPASESAQKIGFSGTALPALLGSTDTRRPRRQLPELSVRARWEDWGCGDDELLDAF